MLENGTETSRMEKGLTTILMETGQVYHLRLCYKLFTDLRGCSMHFEGKGKFFFGSLDKYEGDFSAGR